MPVGSRTRSTGSGVGYALIWYAERAILPGNGHATTRRAWCSKPKVDRVDSAGPNSRLPVRRPAEMPDRAPSMTAPIVLFGTGQIAELAEFYFTHDSSQRIAAYTVDGHHLKEPSLRGLPVVAFEEIEKAFPPDRYAMFVAVSYSGMNTLRAQKFNQARQKGYDLAHYISSKATVWPGFERRANQFILEDNTIQPFACVGENVTLWSGNHIGHHASIGDHVFVASHVVVSGNVTIGQRCFLGVNATIREGIHVADGTLIGAGSLVMKNTAEDSLHAARATQASPVPASRSGL